MSRGARRLRYINVTQCDFSRVTTLRNRKPYGSRNGCKLYYYVDNWFLLIKMPAKHKWMPQGTFAVPFPPTLPACEGRQWKEKPGNEDMNGVHKHPITPLPSQVGYRNCSLHSGDVPSQLKWLLYCYIREKRWCHMRGKSRTSNDGINTTEHVLLWHSCAVLDQRLLSIDNFASGNSTKYGQVRSHKTMRVITPEVTVPLTASNWGQPVHSSLIRRQQSHQYCVSGHKKIPSGHVISSYCELQPMFLRIYTVWCTREWRIKYAITSVQLESWRTNWN